MYRLLGVVATWFVLLVAAPAVAMPPVEAYGKLPAIEQVRLSPSGNRYAYIAVDGEKRVLAAADVGAKTALYVSPVGNAKVVGVDWAGEDHILVTVRHTVPLGLDFDVSKAEFETVIVISLTDRKLMQVFAGLNSVADVVEGQYGYAEIKGHWYGYFGGITYRQGADATYRLDHTWADLYRVDLDSGNFSLVGNGDEDTDGWLVGPDGGIIARSTYNNGNGAWSIRAGSFGERVLLSGNSKIESVGALQRGRTADTILAFHPSDKGMVYDEIRVSDGQTVNMPDTPGISGAVSDPVSGLWIGTVDATDHEEPAFFSPVAEARARGVINAFPGLSVHILSFTPELGRIIVETSGTGDSGTVWLVDMATLRADPIGYEYPDVGPDDVGTIKMVDWAAADGLALHGVLNLPPGREAKNLPVVVMPHGGPEDRDYPEFWWWSQLFASRGYAVFQPNFRGSSGYGSAFRDAGFGQWGRKMQTDISDGFAALVKQGVVDPKRACIVGWSYGGYVALAGVTVQNGFYRCAVSMAGVADLAGMLDYTRDYSGDASESERYWKKFMGVTSVWESELVPISPVKQAAKADAPILLIHGKDDTVVPISQSQSMERALKNAGKPVEFVSLPGADHSLLHQDTRLAMAQASIAFVLKYDPPDLAPPTAVAAAAGH